MKKGHGCFDWADGAKFEGEFVDNNIEGEGVYTWPDER